MGLEQPSPSLKAWLAAFIRITSHEMGLETELHPEDGPFLEFLRAHSAILRPEKRQRESPDAPAGAEKRTCRKRSPPTDPRLRRRSKSAGAPEPEQHQPSPWKAPSPKEMIMIGGLQVYRRNLFKPRSLHLPATEAPATATQMTPLPLPKELLQQKQGPPQEEPQKQTEAPASQMTPPSLKEPQQKQGPPQEEPQPQRSTSKRQQRQGPKPPEPLPEPQPQLCPPPEGPDTQPPAGPSQEPHTNLGPPPQADPQTSYASKAAAADTAEASKKQKKAQQQPQPSQQPRKEKYPHIEAAVLPQWYKVCEEIAKELGRAPYSKNMGRGVRFEPQTADEYRCVYNHLEKLEQAGVPLEWHVYQLDKEKRMKVALRGIPSDTPVEEIKKACEGLGYPVEYVKQINARGGKPGCVYFIQLAGPPRDFTHFYRVTELLYMNSVKIEAWRDAGKQAQNPAQHPRSRDRSRGPASPPNVEESAPASLMAAANAPTQRGGWVQPAASVPNSNKKNKKKKKKKPVEAPPPSKEEAPAGTPAAPADEQDLAATIAALLRAAAAQGPQAVAKALRTTLPSASIHPIVDNSVRPPLPPSPPVQGTGGERVSRMSTKTEVMDSFVDFYCPHLHEQWLEYKANLATETNVADHTGAPNGGSP
ncbi:titin-like [Cydia fagiglandana]|uniref:titin-like n=1 Tax=Cydia fagiglandana TaxID=1458189 RepID=UPI002FEE638E